MRFEAIGIGYSDIFPDIRTIKRGGVYNFPGNKHFIGTGYVVWGPELTKEIHWVKTRSKRLNINPNSNMLVMYGDEVPIELFTNSNIGLLAVDFANQYQNLCPILVREWAKIANILFFSIPDELCTLDFPFCHTNVVAHSSKGVYCYIDGEKFIVKNDWYDASLGNLIGAGDNFSANILNDTRITRTSVRNAIKKTVEYLRKQNGRIQI